MSHIKLPVRRFLFILFILLAFSNLNSQSIGVVNGKASVAVIGSSKDYSFKIESELLKVNYVQLVDRKHVHKVLNEIKLGQMGALKEGSFTKAGEILGVGYLVVVEDSGAFKLIHSQSSRVLGSWASFSGDNLMQLTSILESEVCISEFLVVDRKKRKDEIKIEINEVSADKEFGGAKFDDEITCDFKVVTKNKDLKEVYISIYVFTSDGTLIQVFPNKYQSDNKFPTNKEFLFPPKNAPKKFKLIAAPPAGEDTMVIIASNEPVSFPEKNFLSAGNFKFVEKNKMEGVKGVMVKFDNSTLIYDIEKVQLLIKEK